MKKHFGTKVALLLLSLPFIQQVSAQNIVTIFGQEKVEKTDEGTVFHHFDKGLLLPGGTNPGTLFNGQDMVAWLYATNQFVTPNAGDKLPYSYPNVDSQVIGAAQQRIAARSGKKLTPTLPPWEWATIEVDSAGVFNDWNMRSAYLYTSYDSPNEELALLETTGGTRCYINGLPHEGDHYDFGYTLIPFKIKKGKNEIIHTPGRFGRVTAKLVKPEKPVMFTKRDMTLPDLIVGENEAKWGAIRVINSTDKPLNNLLVRATLSNVSIEIKAQSIMPLSVRKIKFDIPPLADSATPGESRVRLTLVNDGKVVDETEITLRQVLPSVHHERTFISHIDGSIQYYSIAPAIRKHPKETKAMVLTVHGAGVEARNQARAYELKEWTDIVAATNRRPYGFNWEEWGRIDALEVLEEAKRVFNPDLSRIYLKGHSMGGHGSWFLGTTYPDKFAAVAPCAGYPDIASYGRGRSDDMHKEHKTYKAFEKGANGGRVLSLVRNLQQSGVYIFHGSADSVVSPSQARKMRKILSDFHPDFCYYEYPGGEHWFGNQSVDWHPIFEFFSRHNIPETKNVGDIDFHTASPAISASDYWVKVEQQAKPYEFTNIQAKWENDTIKILKAKNATLLVLDIPALGTPLSEILIQIESQVIAVTTHRKAILSLENNKWKLQEGINPKHKYSKRYGGFKNAYDNQVVFVYATKGTKVENEWYENKARFDAETFYYRGNGSIEVISDVAYSLSKYKNRNVIIYGNKDNNKAWSLLLNSCPIQVGRGEISAGKQTYSGDNLGTYFLYPHPENDLALVGVVAGTGDAGMRATSPNNYISGITGFPDFMIFRADMLRDGLEAMEVAAYFDNNWTLDKVDF